MPVVDHRLGGSNGPTDDNVNVKMVKIKTLEMSDAGAWCLFHCTPWPGTSHCRGKCSASSGRADIGEINRNKMKPEIVSALMEINFVSYTSLVSPVL